MSEEDEKFKKNLIYIFKIALIFGLPLLVFFARPTTNNIAKKLMNHDTFVLLITKNDCPKCSMTKQVLNDNKIKPYELNKDKNPQYDNIISELKINNSKEDFPIVVYIKEGKNKGSLFSIDKEKDIENFIVFNKLNQNQ